MSEHKFTASLIVPNTLFWVCTTCRFSMSHPQPIPRWVLYAKVLERCLLLSTRKLVSKLALERNGPNFVTKLNLVPHLAWGLYYMSINNGLPQAQSQGAPWVKVFREVYYRILPCLSLSWLWKGANKILLQNLIMPSNSFGFCSTWSCPMGYSKPSSRGHHRSKSGGRFTIEY